MHIDTFVPCPGRDIPSFLGGKSVRLCQDTRIEVGDPDRQGVFDIGVCDVDQIFPDSVHVVCLQDVITRSGLEHDVLDLGIDSQLLRASDILFKKSSKLFCGSARFQCQLGFLGRHDRPAHHDDGDDSDEEKYEDHALADLFHDLVCDPLPGFGWFVLCAHVEPPFCFFGSDRIVVLPTVCGTWQQRCLPRLLSKILTGAGW